MSRKLKEPVFDDDNPEWTKADFAQKTPTKVAVSIRLSPEVISHFKAKGSGWQSRIDDALRKIVKKAG